MGWSQQIEYVEEAPVPRKIKKHLWNGTEFIPTTFVRLQSVPTNDQISWLTETFGYDGKYISGAYWEYSRAGGYTLMDEKVYTWFKIKWGNE